MLPASGLSFMPKKDMFCCVRIRLNKEIRVFMVRGLKILEKKYLIFFLEKVILYILKGISPFKIHRIIFFD